MRQRQGAVGGSEQLGTEKCLPAFRLCEGGLFSWKLCFSEVFKGEL